MAAGLSWWSAKSFWVTPRMDNENDEGPLGWVMTTAGIDLVISVACTAPASCRSVPEMAEIEMPTSCAFCARFWAVTTTSCNAPFWVVSSAAKAVEAQEVATNDAHANTEPHRASSITPPPDLFQYYVNRHYLTAP